MFNLCVKPLSLLIFVPKYGRGVASIEQRRLLPPLFLPTYNFPQNDERQQREQAVSTGLHQPRADISSREYLQAWDRFGHRSGLPRLTLRNIIAHARN